MADGYDWAFSSASILLELYACAFCCRRLFLLPFKVFSFFKYRFSFQFRMFMVSFLSPLSLSLAFFSFLCLFLVSTKTLGMIRTMQINYYEFACCFPIAWEPFKSKWFTSIVVVVVVATDASLYFSSFRSFPFSVNSIKLKRNQRISLTAKLWVF